MSNVIVIYHAGCWDGFCAAWVFRKAFRDAEFHPAHHGTLPPDVTGKRVIMVDFSYPRETMIKLCRNCQNNLIVLDHHKTAEEDLAGLASEVENQVLLCPSPYIRFDMSKSGSRLAWEHLFPSIRPHWLVQYTEDRDLWRWALPYSREVNAALRSYPLDFDTWDSLSQRHLWLLKDEGAAILRYQQGIIDRHVRLATEFQLAEHSVLAVNATELISEIAGELAKICPFGVAYFDKADGKRQFSLRSRPDGVDVSDIAKRFGGGGHKHAAGFEMSWSTPNVMTYPGPVNMEGADV